MNVPAIGFDAVKVSFDVHVPVTEPSSLWEMNPVSVPVPVTENEIPSMTSVPLAV